MIESEEQTNKVSQLYRRQVSLPIYQNDETYKEFKQHDQAGWKASKTAYDQARLKMGEIEPFEAAIRTADKNPAEQLEAWRDYIKHELKKDDPVRIEFLYRRATSRLCLNPALWAEFLTWQKKMNSPGLLETAKRACRNCTWEATSWLDYLKIAEIRDHQLLDQIKDDAIKALMGSATSVDIIGLLRHHLLARG